MNNSIISNILYVLFFSVFLSSSGQNCFGQKTSENNEKLKKALIKYPKADFNSDGILTEDELMRYMGIQRQIEHKIEDLKKMPDRVLKDYSYGPHWRNTLDFWKAESDKPTPVLIWFHGGGFRAGDKSNMYGDSLAISCLNNGISVITANYRYIMHTAFPGPFLDAARVIQYVRYNAMEWGIDPDRIATTGNSAGGNLSVWLAVHDDLADPNSKDPVLRHSTRLTTIIAKNAQTSNDPFYVWENIYNGNDVYGSAYDFYGVEVMGKDGLIIELSKNKYREIAFKSSSLNHITKDDPPVFLIYPERLEEWNGQPLPDGTESSKYIHHVSFGKFFKDEYDKLGLQIRLRAHKDVSVREQINWLKKHFNYDRNGFQENN